MSQPIELIGRARELEHVERFLSSDDSVARALILEGPAGIGKTAIWQAAVAREVERGHGYSSRARREEQDFAFTALADLFAALDGEALATLPDIQRSALTAALMLGEIEQPISMRAVAAATLGVLRSQGRNGRLVIALDDVPWLDSASGAALAFAFRRLEQEPVRFLLTRRAMEAQPPRWRARCRRSASRSRRSASAPPPRCSTIAWG